jgi:pyruvate-ferredoxin/flavodoxin oxidoreductase
MLSNDDLRFMINDDLIIAHRNRSLNPDNPFIRGTAQNPDVYFQARETVNLFYDKVPAIVQQQMDKFATLTYRQYKLVEYTGSADAERVIVIMGSGAETANETALALTNAGEKVGILNIRLYRPFPSEYVIAALPDSVKTIAVLDRTKEPGADGEPLYKDVITAFTEAYSAGSVKALPKIVGGRYGLSSKEFTPAMVKGVFDELKKEQPKNHFTIGINDDVSFTSLDYDCSFELDEEGMTTALFYGLGADGTVSANKNSIKPKFCNRLIQ